MPLEMDDEKAQAKSGHYQYYFYQQPASEVEEMSAAASGENKPVAEHHFPKFSPRLYFLILIPPWDKINLTFPQDKITINNLFHRIILEQSYALYDSEFAESLYPILLFSIAVSIYDVMVKVPVVVQVFMIE